ncbi:endonuclease/exonuclease/phosphatase family protein [Myxococcota bacterium]|nr:endonuclease/exonuclease/phosphatase family protein [Myxococcota bacterium]
MLTTLAVIFVVLVVAVLWMAGGVQSPKTFDEPARALDDVPAPSAAELAATSTITVVTWNVAWGYGWGSEGSGQAKPKEHFESTTKRLGGVLRSLGADVVLLQEVDFDATRSHRVDQAEIIARAAGLRYVARALSWKAQWVPFPYWPPSEHFGHMRSGGAILSRFPITANTVALLDKPAANAWWYNLFYLFRYFQRAELDVGGTKLQVVNVHLEAFDRANRVTQAEQLKRALEAATTPLTILGGDLNTVPPEQSKRKDYPDEPETSHVDDPTLEIVRGIRGLSDVTPPETLRANEPEWMTFPAFEPNRKLDFVLAGEGLRVVDARVARSEAGDVSDHLPLVTRLTLKK